MRVTCLNGYFMFREDQPGEVARFNSTYSQDLERKDDYYTFALLATAPDYSIALAPYLNLIATETYEGHPHEVFRENGFVYDSGIGFIRLAASISTLFEPVQLYDKIIANGLIQPGSVTKNWQKVTGYQGFIDTNQYKFYYSEIFYD